jgi:Fe-Mn family superoxide dismutase
LKVVWSFDEFKLNSVKQNNLIWIRLGLVVFKDGLEFCGTPNQDNPLMPGVAGWNSILGMDVWEHALLLALSKQRPDYIEAFFNVINWTEVSRRFASDK